METGALVNGLTILLLLWAVAYVPLTAYLYGRQRRWLGMLGWDRYDKPVEIITEYFPSSGTGQLNAVFPLP